MGARDASLKKKTFNGMKKIVEVNIWYGLVRRNKLAINSPVSPGFSAPFPAQPSSVPPLG